MCCGHSQKRYSHLLRISGSPLPAPPLGSRNSTRLLQPQGLFVLGQPRSRLGPPRRDGQPRAPSSSQARPEEALHPGGPPFLPQENLWSDKASRLWFSKPPRHLDPPGEEGAEPHAACGSGAGTWFWALYSHSYTTGPPLTAARSGGCVAGVAGRVGHSSCSQQLPPTPGAGWSFPRGLGQAPNPPAAPQSRLFL